MRDQIFNLAGVLPPYILWLLLCLVHVLKQSITMDRKTALATGATRLTNLDWVASQTEQQFLPLKWQPDIRDLCTQERSPTELNVWSHGRVQLERWQ